MWCSVLPTPSHIPPASLPERSPRDGRRRRTTTTPAARASRQAQKLEHLQALSVKAVQLAAQRAASMEDEKDDASEQPPPHRPLMRKGAAVGFVVAPRVDAVLAQCDESALPPPPGRKPRTPAKRSKAEPRARVRGVEGEPRARAARPARRGPAPPSSNPSQARGGRAARVVRGGVEAPPRGPRGRRPLRRPRAGVPERAAPAPGFNFPPPPETPPPRPWSSRSRRTGP